MSQEALSLLISLDYFSLGITALATLSTAEEQSPDGDNQASDDYSDEAGSDSDHNTDHDRKENMKNNASDEACDSAMSVVSMMWAVTSMRTTMAVRSHTGAVLPVST